MVPQDVGAVEMSGWMLEPWEGSACRWTASTEAWTVPARLRTLKT